MGKSQQRREDEKLLPESQEFKLARLLCAPDSIKRWHPNGAVYSLKTQFTPPLKEERDFDAVTLLAEKIFLKAGISDLRVEKEKGVTRNYLQSSLPMEHFESQNKKHLVAIYENAKAERAYQLDVVKAMFTDASRWAVEGAFRVMKLPEGADFEEFVKERLGAAKINDSQIQKSKKELTVKIPKDNFNWQIIQMHLRQDRASAQVWSR